MKVRKAVSVEDIGIQLQDWERCAHWTYDCLSLPIQRKVDSRTAVNFPSKGLYAITDGPRADLHVAVAAAIAGGARVVQYRDKTLDPIRQHEEASSLARLCADSKIPFIINDDARLALDCSADGVHLGADDIDLRAARSLLGDSALIGVSCYDSIERAREAVAEGANYVAFGAFYATGTKPLARRANRNLLSEARELPIPKVAIGGITPENAGDLIQSGADLIAVVSSLFSANDISACARRFSRLFPTAKSNP